MFRTIPGELVALVIFLAIVAVIAVASVTRRLKATSKIVYEQYAGIRYVNGKITEVLGPGVHYAFWPGTAIMVEDLRERQIAVPAQEVMTADSLTVRVSVVARARVADIRLRHGASRDPFDDLYLDLQVALRKAIATRTLEGLLANRDAIAPEVAAAVKTSSAARGLEVTEVDVRDVMLSGEAKRAFADIFRARKEGEAALERARGETAALRNLANGARLLKDNPHLYQLRLLQTLAAPSAKGATVVLNASGEPTPPGVAASSTASPPATGPGGDD